MTNVVIRQNNNYILGDSSENTTTGFNIQVSYYERNTGNVRINIYVPEKNAKTINNDAVGITILGLKLKFN